MRARAIPLVSPMTLNVFVVAFLIASILVNPAISQDKKSDITVRPTDPPSADSVDVDLYQFDVRLIRNDDDDWQVVEADWRRGLGKPPER